MAVVFDSDDVVGVVWVVVAQVKQDFKLNSGLMLELFLVSYYLDRHNFFGFVVEALQGLSKAPFSKKVNNFEPESNLVFEHDVVVAAFVVVAEVKRVALTAVDLLGVET